VKLVVDKVNDEVAPIEERERLAPQRTPGGRSTSATSTTSPPGSASTKALPLPADELDSRRKQGCLQARLEVFDFIEGFYNPRRRHSALGYLSPAEYEQTQDNSIKMNNNDRTAIAV
jgi:hypothetical protein